MSTKKTDVAKEVTAGAVGLVAVVAGAPAFIAALAVPLVGLGFIRVASRAQRKAQQLFERMLASDEEPSSFADELNKRVEADDEATLAAFQVLLTAALRSISPDALAAMGAIGKRLCRNETSLPLARSAVDALSELDSAELRSLHRLLLDLEPIDAEWILVVSDRPARADGDTGWRAHGARSHGSSTVAVTPFPNPQRMFGCLKRAGVGTDTGAYGLGGSPMAIEIERAAAVLLRDGLDATAR